MVAIGSVAQPGRLSKSIPIIRFVELAPRSRSQTGSSRRREAVHAGTYVLAAKPEFEMVAHNVVEDDDSRANACPVVSNGNLLLRNDTYLYCIGD